MTQFYVKPVGYVRINGEEMFIELEKDCVPALQGLEGFSHLQVLWWFSGCDVPKMRDTVRQMHPPYRTAPGVMGVFAMRSPARPNPIALSAAQITNINYTTGRIDLAYIDADDGTPVLDLKPYSPCLDRVNSAMVPQWCAHWPQSLEESAVFDWNSEFAF